MIAPDASARKRPAIVVLEDDHGVRRSLQLLLQGRNYEVKAFASAESLLTDPEVAKAACLLADYRLEETDGIAVLQTLRRQGWTGPALLMTAYGSQELSARALAAGFSEVLEKPFGDRALLNALGRVVDLAGD